MENDDFVEIWEKSESDKNLTQNHITMEMIERNLVPRLSKAHWYFSTNLIINILTGFLALVLLPVNMYIYRNNPHMFIIETILLVIVFISMIYGIYIYIKLREINNFSKSIRELLIKKVEFVRFYYEIWLIVISFLVLILIFAINTFVDCNEGLYKINNPLSYGIIHAFIFGFIYLLNKMTAGIWVKKMKLYLDDLTRQSLDNIEIDLNQERKRKIIYVLVFFVITGLLGYSIYLFYLNS
jgi:hypothetical protein